MGKKLERITPELIEFIENQKVFLSELPPLKVSKCFSKGTDSFRVIDENKIVWLNLTGSGNETAAHLILNNRMTIMFCAFEGNPMILRLYGHAKIFHKKTKLFKNT